MFRSILILIFTIFSFDAFSQASANGCLLPNGLVYTQPIAAANTYKRNGPTLMLSPDYCSWSPSSGSPCTVCTSYFNVNCLLDSSPTEGVQGFFTMVECPLDDSAAVIFSAAALFAYIRIRKRP